jgi:hypothetical protein
MIEVDQLKAQKIREVSEKDIELEQLRFEVK